MYSKIKIEQLFFILVVFLTVLATVSLSSGREAELGIQTHNVDSHGRFSAGNSETISIEPETTQNLFQNSEMIVYARIVNVVNKIKKAELASANIEATVIFPEQSCTASLLWVLKGDEGLQNDTVCIIKEKSRYYLSEKEEMVLYLRKDGNLFRTIDSFGGEHRLPSALCDIKNLKRDATTGGIIAAFHKRNDESSNPIVYVLKGRRKASLKIGDNEWNRSLWKTSEIGDFNICEIPLQEGLYTVLMERSGQLFSYTRLVGGYYACVMIGGYRWWEPLYFGP